MIDSKLEEQDSRLLFFFLNYVTVEPFVLSWCQSLHLLSGNDPSPAWSWRAWHPSQPRVCDFHSFPFALERGLEIHSSLLIQINAEETSSGRLWDLTVKNHCKKFLCTVAGLSMSLFFCVTDVGNRKSEEPAVLRCLWKQVGKTSWRNQWPDFINGFSHFPELTRNDSGWHR